MKFAGKVVVVTGASSGIGRQAAVDFAKRGAERVILVSRSEPKLSQLAGEMAGTSPGCDAVPYACDVSDKAQVLRMGRDVLDRFGRVDVLVNNAGFAVFKSVNCLSIEEIESMTATNYHGMVYCTKAFLDSMLARRSGHIVNVASLAASFGVAGLAPYCATKFAMLGFSESLHHELAGTGVRVTVVSPIAVRTNFFNNESFGGRAANYTGSALDPKTVSRAVLAAANSSRLEITVPFYARGAVWFKHTLPYVVQPIVGAVSRRQVR
ncbi:MAG TPA: SDR family NAD(P)-dependent oxidoreductase [Nitrososphaera sp.]|nr:SDR family NAD(P)-dependent oxidoreductase [Nitrososphaera sp.]